MRKRIIFLIMLLILVSLLLTACSSNKNSSSGGMGSEYAPPAAPPYARDNPAESMPSADSAEYETASVSLGNQVSAPMNPEDGLKIIYTASGDIQTKEYEESYDSLMTILRENGGYVSNSSVSGGYTSESGFYFNRSAYMTLRVPVEKYRIFLEATETVGTITNLNEYTDDITSSYIDTEARLKTLKAQESRLLELLSGAEVIGDMIEIESKLSDVRYQIESYQSQMNTFDKLLAYSTVTINLQEVTDIALPKDTFDQRIVAATKGSGEAIVDFFKWCVIVLIYLLPFLVVAFIIFLIVRLIIKKTAPRRAKKRAKKMEARFANMPYPQQQRNYGPPPPIQEIKPNPTDERKE